MSISPSLCLSHVLVQIYCPLCDQLPSPSVSQRRGGNTVKSSHITASLLITGGPRRVTVILATRINARIWRAECLSKPLINAQAHTDWFYTGCQPHIRFEREYTCKPTSRTLEIRLLQCWKSTQIETERGKRTHTLKECLICPNWLLNDLCL